MSDYPAEQVENDHLNTVILELQRELKITTLDLTETQAQLTAARAELADEEKKHLRTIDERDTISALAEAIFEAIGLTEEESTWSNANDPMERAVEAIERLRAELAALKAKASGTDWINAVTPPSPTRAEVVSDRYLTLDPWGGPVRILTFVHATQEWTENGDDLQRVAWYAPIPGRAALAETKEDASNE